MINLVSFIYFYNLSEPNARTFYDPSLLENFPKFSLDEFSDENLDTKSNMFLINKGTFSSL